MALGRSHFLYESIKAVAAVGHTITCIATSKAAPEYTRTASDFGNLARELKADFIYFDRPSEINQFDIGNTDVGISVNWHTIITEQFINSFPKGIINAHIGDLPRYRGNACPNWAILNGEDHVGITLHKMTADLDAGPIVIKEIYPLKQHTEISDVYNYAELVIPKLFIYTLTRLDSPNFKTSPQEGKSLRCYPRHPIDNKIEWQQSAEQIHRLIRASTHPFSGAFTHLNGAKIIVWRAYTEQPAFDYLAVPGQVLERRTDGSIAVATGDGWLIMDEYAPHIIKSHRDRLT